MEFKTYCWCHVADDPLRPTLGEWSKDIIDSLVRLENMTSVEGAIIPGHPKACHDDVAVVFRSLPNEKEFYEGRIKYVRYRMRVAVKREPRG